MTDRRTYRKAGMGARALMENTYCTAWKLIAHYVQPKKEGGLATLGGRSPEGEVSGFSHP